MKKTIEARVIKDYDGTFLSIKGKEEEIVAFVSSENIDGLYRREEGRFVYLDDEVKHFVNHIEEKFPPSEIYLALNSQTNLQNPNGPKVDSIMKVSTAEIKKGNFYLTIQSHKNSVINDSIKEEYKRISKIFS